MLTQINLEWHKVISFSNKQFLIVYHILDLFILGGETVFSASFMAYILVFRLELFTVWGYSVCFIG